MEHLLCDLLDLPDPKPEHVWTLFCNNKEMGGGGAISHSERSFLQIWAWQHNPCPIRSR